MTTFSLDYPAARDGSAKAASLVIGFLLMLVFAGPLLSIKPQPFTGEGNPVRQISYIIALGLAIWTSRGYLEPRRLLAIPASLMLALLWCAISLSWALSPDVGVRRLILTFTVIWSIFIAVRTAGFERTVQIVQIAFAGCLLLNYAAVAVLPSGIHRAAELGDPGLVGDWRGILAHKNFAGSVTAVTILFFALGRSKIKPMLRYAILIAAAFFLYQTHSKTSGVFTIVCLVVGWLFNRYNPKYRSLIIPGLLIFAVILIVAVQGHVDALLEPFNRPDALTGRVQIWPVLINYAASHPLTGAGYGSFWNIGQESPVFDYTRSWVKELGNGHNGYLDLLVQVGIPGLFLIVMATMIIPIGKLFASRTMEPGRGGLMLAMIVFCMGNNITESSLFERDTIIQVFLMMAVALTEVATQDEAGRRKLRSRVMGRGPVRSRPTDEPQLSPTR